MRCVYVRLKWRSVAVAVIPLTLVREVKGSLIAACVLTPSLAAGSLRQP